MFRHFTLTVALALPLFLSFPRPVYAGFTPIQDPGSGGEPGLWAVLDEVAPITLGWGDADALNFDAAERRILDDMDTPGEIVDQVWYGDQVKVTILALFWGGGDSPADGLWRGEPAQRLIWTDSLDGADPRDPDTGVVNIDHRAGAFDLGAPGPDGPHPFLLGDRRKPIVRAWSLPDLNRPWTIAPPAGDPPPVVRDRMVTFDVSGLTVYAWDHGVDPAPGSGKRIVRAPEDAGPAYVVAFEAGIDGDFQDMVVLVEGAMVPEPAALVVLSIGGVAMLARAKSRRRI